ncbi:thioredoxin family protein [Niabella sp. 22666]|uniref:thioredoxin family protein n=1 Tax=Niabella sp. 22666 TaxID=3453954 RepID=UPI003F845115
MRYYIRLIGFLATFGLMGKTLQAQSRLDEALKSATAKHALVLLNFSGSDWCIPCIKMHQTIIDSEDFQKLLNDSTVLYVNADFPRNRKNQLPDQLKKENATLADKYNPGGSFPCSVLLAADGRVLKKWEGLPGGDARSFVKEIESFR